MENRFQEALEDIKNEHFLEYSNNKGFARRIDTLQELIDKCVFINEEWKQKNNVYDTFLIETPTDRSCVPQGVDYE